MIQAARCCKVHDHNNESLGMSEVQAGASSALFGRWGQTNVSRGVSEFRAGRPVLVTSKPEIVLALPVDGLDGQRLAEFMALCSPVVPRLIITEQRALALGLDSSTPMALARPDARAQMRFWRSLPKRQAARSHNPSRRVA